jgi:uncharacterized membrane protein YgcG
LQRILRSLLLLAALLGTLALAACGGDDGKEASSDTDVDTLLKQTFEGGKEINSGKVDFRLRMNITGGANSQVSGPVDISLSGPFQSEGKAKLPQLGLAAKITGGGQNITAGVTVTEDKGYVNFNGQDYVLSDQVFQQFKQGYEQAAAKGSKENNDQSLARLGIDPRNWLTNAKNEGEAKVGDTDVIKITGDVDIGKLLDDVNTALAKAGSLGVQGAAQLPTKLTDDQKAQIEKAVKDVSVEIYTGKDDSILRRLALALKVDDPQAQADVKLDFSLLDLNEDQDFSAPSDPKPFDELLGQLGGLVPGLGAGGAAGGGGSGSGSGGSSGSGSGSGGSSGTSSAKLQEYTKCLEDAGQDLEKAQKCAELLTP